MLTGRINKTENQTTPATANMESPENTQEVLSEKKTPSSFGEKLMRTMRPSGYGNIQMKSNANLSNSKKVSGGHYYNYDGTYLGSDGLGNNVYSVCCIDDETASKGMTSTELIDLKNREHVGSTDPTVTELAIKHDKFTAIAGTLYAEGTPGGVSFEEAAAIYCTMRNRANAKGSSVYSVAGGGGIYGWSERTKITSKNANKQSAKNCYKAVLDCLQQSTDYSNGAYYWQGEDFRGPRSYSTAHESFYKIGFEFTNASHDIWNLGSIKSGKKEWDYKYESTAAKGQTTFMKLTDEWKKATGYKG